MDPPAVLVTASAFLHVVDQRWPHDLPTLRRATGWSRWAELPLPGADVLFADDRSRAAAAAPVQWVVVDRLGVAAGNWLAAVGLQVDVAPTSRRTLEQARDDVVAGRPAGSVVWLVEHGAMTVASARWASVRRVVRVPFDPLVGCTRRELDRVVSVATARGVR